MIRTGLVVVASALLTISGVQTASAAPSTHFFSPQPDSRVAGPKVEVQIDAPGFKLVPAGTPVFEGEGHAHLLIDREPIAGGEIIPAGVADIIHLGTPPFDVREVSLSPGNHTLVVQLADSAHRALKPVATGKVTFTVASGEAFRGNGPLTPGCADIATGSAALSMVFPLQGGLVQGVMKSTCGFATEGGSCKFSEEGNHKILGGFDPETGTVDAKAYGKVTRRLVEGNPQVCGATSTSPQTESAINANYANGQVSGSLGGAQFTLKSNPALVLSAPPDAAATTATTAASATTEKDDDGLPVGRIALGLGAVALIAIAATPLIRRRRFSSSS
jgi:hypothetical protein